MDSLLRLAERKYVDWRSSSGPTNGGPQPRVSSPWPGRLDLDDPGAEVAEHHRGVRAGQGAGEVDDQDAVQRPGHEPHPGRTSAAQTSSGPTRVTITP